ncbi:MAG: hypothetical protein AAB355_02940 [Patescibacteria group bacterium]
MVGDPCSLLSVLVSLYRQNRNVSRIVFQLHCRLITAGEATDKMFGMPAEREVYEFFRLVSEKNPVVISLIKDVRSRKIAVDDAEKEILEVIRERQTTPLSSRT